MLKPILYYDTSEEWNNPVYYWEYQMEHKNPAYEGCTCDADWDECCCDNEIIVTGFGRRLSRRPFDRIPIPKLIDNPNPNTEPIREPRYPRVVRNT